MVINRLVFKTKVGHQPELQTAETMKVSGSKDKNNRQNKEWRKCTKSYVVEIVSVQCNLVDKY